MSGGGSNGTVDDHTHARRTLLVLGGRPIGSCDIVNYAKSRGARVIVCDYLPSCEAPAKQLADECWDISTADVDTIVHRALSAGVDAVFTGAHDFNILQANRVCSMLALPFYATAEQLAATTDKRYYKAKFAEHGMSLIPNYHWDGAKQFPLLIKPVEGSGGFGITLCRDQVELDAFRAAKPAGIKDDERLMLEAFIHGEEVTAFYMLRNGHIHLTALADRLTTPVGQDSIELPYFYRWPSRLLADYQQMANPQVTATLRSLGLMDGMVFVQLLVRDGQFFPYDMGFRITGTQEYHLLDQLCGINPLQMLVEYAFTGEMGNRDLTDRVDPWFGGQHAACMTFLIRPGTIGVFQGLDLVEAIPNVVRAIRNHEPGTEIAATSVGTLKQIALRVLIAADTCEELRGCVEQVSRYVRVLDQRGADMLIASPFSKACS